MAKVILQAQGSGTPVAVEFQRSGDRFTATVEGQSFEGSFEEAPGGGYSLRIGHCVQPCHVVRKNSHVEVWLGGEIYRFEILGGKSRRPGGGAAPVAREITAPMPGTILRIHVKPGDAFAAHQPLIIMESMKMEMTLSAPHAGRVRQVLCAAGELAAMGKVLLQLDPEETNAQVSA